MMNKFKARLTIVVVGATPPPHHGMTIFAENLLKSKLHNWFHVIHLDTSDHRTLDNLGRFDFWNAYCAVKNLFALISKCLSEKPGIVYVPVAQNSLSFFRDGLFILIGRWFSRARTIIHYHGGESFLTFWRNANSIMKWYIPFVLKRVDVAIVLGERLQYIFNSIVARVVAVPNGITFKSELKPYRRHNGGVVSVSYLGGLFKAKGVVDMVRAAPLVLEKSNSVRFRFAGEWWAQEPHTKCEVKQILRDLHIESHVSFLGKIVGEAKDRYLLETDIFVLPSWSEGLPLVILEAMAAGCPVIATNVGAIPEVVVDGVTGILVEKRNPQQLAHAIVTLIDNPDLRRRMGEAGRKRFEEHYTFDKCAERLIAVFERVLHEDSP